MVDERPPKSVIVRGSLWAMAGYGTSQVLRLGGNLVLWRLLSPETFGVMAVVSVVLQGLAMFSDVGIGPSIIQNERGEQAEYLNTAWTIQVGRGIAIFAVATALAYPLAGFYKEPRLVTLIPAAALGSVIAGFNSTSLFTATRRIALGRLMSLEIAQQAVGLVVMVAWGLVRPSVWALVAGGLAANTVKLVASHTLLPGIRNRFLWHRESGHVLIHFGRWIFLSTLLTFAVGQSDRLIFGGMVPMDRLGVYHVGAMWATLPNSVLGQILHHVLFPVMSRLQRTPALFQEEFRRLRFPWLILAGWISACLIAGGPSLVRLLYDARAAEAGWVVQILALGTWFNAIEMTNGSALLAHGMPKWMAGGNAAKLVGMAVFIPIGVHFGGFHGAVTGYALSELMRYVLSVAGTMRLRLKSFPQELSLSLAVAGSALVGWLLRNQAHALLASEVPSERLAAFLECAAVALALGAVWLVLLRMGRPKAHRVASEERAELG